MTRPLLTDRWLRIRVRVYVDIGITLHVLVCAGHHHVNAIGSVLHAYVTINLQVHLSAVAPL